MDALRFNKIAAAVLCAGLLIMGFSKVGSFLVNPKDLKENAYPIEVANVDAKNTQVKEITIMVLIIGKIHQIYPIILLMEFCLRKKL